MFNSGELAVQQMADEQAIAARVGRMIGDSLAPHAVTFIREQQLVVVATTDKKGQMWASAFVGELGFLDVPNPQTIHINKHLLKGQQDDLLFENMEHNPQAGLLFFDPVNRRRYRANGLLSDTLTHLVLDVREAYPNCPKYIQQRILTFKDKPGVVSSLIQAGQDILPEHIDWIRRADTFFMATQGIDGKSDASHRGGQEGFIQITPDQQLLIPDYPGNSLFNSLGNIKENPHAGLLFINFDTGDTLQLSGSAGLEFGKQEEELLQQSGGTGRYWSFKPQSWRFQAAAVPVSSDFIGFSPFNPH